MKSWRAQGIEVVIVGNGNRDFAEDFREEFGIEGRLLVDSDLHAYRAAGLRRGRREIVSTRILGNAIRALRSGARQAAIQGDPWQLGGVFVIAPGGELRFEYRSVAAGDHAAPEAIEAALDEFAEAVPESDSGASLLAPALNALRPALDASPFFSFDRVGYQRHAAGFDPADLDVDLYGRRCLVTGADSGMGYETALALADLGAEVVLLGPDRARGADTAKAIREATGNRRIEALELDVSDFESIDRAVALLTKDPVDALVHAADVFARERIETRDGLELDFATHAVGPHRLTKGLASALEASDDARVVWVSAAAMLTRRLDMADPNWLDREYDGVVAWAETKRAQVVLAELWAEAFDGTSVRVNAMHPGWTDTPAVRPSLPFLHKLARPLLRTPAEGADTIVWLVASPALEGRTGRLFFDREAVRTHWLPATREDTKDRDALWRSCDEP